MFLRNVKTDFQKLYLFLISYLALAMICRKKMRIFVFFLRFFCLISYFIAIFGITELCFRKLERFFLSGFKKISRAVLVT